MVNLVGFAVGLTQARQADVPRAEAARFGLLGAAAPSPLLGAVVVNAALAQQRSSLGRSLFPLQRGPLGGGPLASAPHGAAGGAARRRAELERELRRLHEEFEAREREETQRQEEEQARQEEQRAEREDALHGVNEAFAAYEEAAREQHDGDPKVDVEAARRQLTEALVRLQASVGGAAQQGEQAG